MQNLTLDDLLGDQVLMEQLKETLPGMEEAISGLRQQVDSPDVMSGSNAKEATLGVSSSPPQASMSTRVLSSYKLVTPCSLLLFLVRGKQKGCLFFS